MEGVVRFFNSERAYGFIYLTDESGEAVSPDFFFHQNDVIGDPPERYDAVSFWIDDAPRRAQNQKLIAVEVERIAHGDLVGLEVFEERLAEEAVCA